jgi:hypothetical protein
MLRSGECSRDILCLTFQRQLPRFMRHNIRTASPWLSS